MIVRYFNARAVPMKHDTGLRHYGRDYIINIRE